MSSASLAALALATAAAARATCASRPSTRTDSASCSASEKRGGTTVPRGFDHPVTIASVRAAHILARLDVRMGSEEGGERAAAFPTITLYTSGSSSRGALAQATPDQEVVVQAVRKEQRSSSSTRRCSRASSPT